MLVYGDQEREVAPAALLASIRDAAAQASASRGIVRHGWIATALIEAGELAQGVADHVFRARGEVDAPSRGAAATSELVGLLARALARSWSSHLAAPFDPEGEVAAGLDRLDVADLPGPLTTRNPEGFAHYGLYPEAFLAAAASLPGDAPVHVVGLRSIGTTLAAVVAAGLAEPGETLTVRPTGPPFSRRIAAAPELLAGLLRGREARFAVVDEGPGMSGSSVAAAVALLEEQGVPAGRIHILPGHAGEPGPRADEAVRAAWARCSRHVVAFDDLVLRSDVPAHRLRDWCAELTGPARGPLQDVSGGGWRRHRPGAAEVPVQAGTERRKFLLEARDGTWCLRYAGLGRTGPRKLDLARRLHAAGFAPEPAGLRHGFLVERWLGDARPIDPAGDRPRLLVRLAEYLAFRARLPPGPYRGATCAELLAMARRNADLGLGPEAAGGLDRWAGRLRRLERARRPVATDGRLHAWEWIVARDGAILKTDAVDHHAAHDLVGPQDIAWDVAGAACEFALTGDEEADLHRAIGPAAALDRELAGFLRPCYAAFQLGAWTLARDAEADATDRARLHREVERYRRDLAVCLATDRGGPQGR